MCVRARRISFSPQTDSQPFNGTNSSSIVGVHPVDPWTNLGEEVIELAFIQSKIALEPNLIKAELLNQPVKFSVERPVSQDIVDPNGLTTMGPAFPLQICRCNTKKAAQSTIHGERGNRCMDGLLYMPAICYTYKPRPFGCFRLLWPLPAAEAVGCELLVWAPG